MSSRQQPHEIEAMCLAERRALYWSDRKHAWCHTDGWPCPQSRGLTRGGDEGTLW